MRTKPIDGAGIVKVDNYKGFPNTFIMRSTSAAMAGLQRAGRDWSRWKVAVLTNDFRGMFSRWRKGEMVYAIRHGRNKYLIDRLKWRKPWVTLANVCFGMIPLEIIGSCSASAGTSGKCLCAPAKPAGKATSPHPKAIARKSARPPRSR
jgi:hypothetical protein